jgi:hypothetical protein
MYKFFSKVGIEPTFSVNPEDHPILKLKALGPNSLSRIHMSIVAGIAGAISQKRGWAGNAERDDIDVEIPSPKQYTSLEALMADYRELGRQIAPFRLHPSTVVDYYNDGGCHINVGIADIVSKGRDFRNRFDQNLLCFLNAYPSLVWSMLTPNDNISSKIYAKEVLSRYRHNTLVITSKGWCANSRRNGHDAYWELRFFMMPRTDEEMAFQLKVADRFMRLIFKLTCSGTEVKPINSEADLSHYDWPRAKEELTKVISLLDLKKEPLWELKMESLRERIEVQGKHFLV